MLQSVLQRFRTTRGTQLHALPIGPEGELPWHSTVGQVRRILASHKAASLDVAGMPTARMRWPDRTLRATLEFAEGICLGPTTWLAGSPGAHFARRDGTAVALEPLLRGATVHFEKSDPRGNWRWVVGWLGKPAGRLPDGAWEWRWETGTARWYEAAPGEPGAEWLRFAPNASSRPVEIVNLSSLELYQRVSLRLDFRQGTWLMGSPPASGGVPTRLHWDTPANEILLLTVTAAGVERSAEVPRRVGRVVLTNAPDGGVRIVV